MPSRRAGAAALRLWKQPNRIAPMSDENEVMSTGERLIYMANQIARNLAAEGEAEAVAATAQHIASFWDPRMRARSGGLTEVGRGSWRERGGQYGWHWVGGGSE